MAKYAFSLFALFLVYSALDISYAENSLQTLLDDVLEKIETVNGTLTPDVQNMLNNVYINLEKGIGEAIPIYEELMAKYETTSDSTCTTSFDSLDAVVGTVVADLSDKFYSFVSSSNLNSTQIRSFVYEIITELNEEKDSLSTYFLNAVVACNVTLDF